MYFSERVYEDHEQLVDNLMLWTRDSKNRLLFVERPERTLIFEQPDILYSRSNTQKNEIIDEYAKNNMIEVCIILGVMLV